MPGYRIEYASSGRAKCNGRKPCKGTAIGKGEIRFGTWVTLNEHGSFKWRHWGCLTSSVLKNVAGELDSSIDDLDGFEDLKPEDQTKVRKAFEDGRIDPADVPSTAIAENFDNPNNEAENKEENKTDEANPKKRKRAPAKKPKTSAILDSNDENQVPEDPEQKRPATIKKKEKKVTQRSAKKAVTQELEE